MLPTVAVGTSRLVEREELASFLDRVHKAENTMVFFKELRHKKAVISRRKIRTLVRGDHKPATLTSLPESIGLSRGRLEVSFRSVEQLAEAMYILACILETEGDEFARAYEPYVPEPEPQDAEDIRTLFDELKVMEARAEAQRQNSSQMISK